MRCQATLVRRRWFDATVESGDAVSIPTSVTCGVDLRAYSMGRPATGGYRFIGVYRTVIQGRAASPWLLTKAPPGLGTFDDLAVGLDRIGAIR